MAGGGRIIGAEAAVSRSPPRSFYATRDRVCRNTTLNLASTTPLLLTLFVLLVIVAFSSGTEVAMLSVNRYRIRHRAEGGSGTARTLERLPLCGAARRRRTHHRRHRVLRAGAEDLRRLEPRRRGAARGRHLPRAGAG